VRACVGFRGVTPEESAQHAHQHGIEKHPLLCAAFGVDVLGPGLQVHIPPRSARPATRDGCRCQGVARRWPDPCGPGGTHTCLLPPDDFRTLLR